MCQILRRVELYIEFLYLLSCVLLRPLIMPASNNGRPVAVPVMCLFGESDTDKVTYVAIPHIAERAFDLLTVFLKDGSALLAKTAHHLGSLKQLAFHSAPSLCASFSRSSHTPGSHFRT